MPKLSHAANQTLPMPAAKVPNKIAKRIMRVLSVNQIKIDDTSDYALRKPTTE
jgi:hypothetical protein